MSLRTILDALRSIPPRRSAVRRAGFRPRLESLDERTLPSFSPAASYAVGDSPQAVATGDFNNDSVLDIAVINYGTSTVSVLLGNGNGTFQPAVTAATGAGPLSLVVGDFDGDGDRDIATANLGDVSVLLGNGNGTFGAPTSIPLSDGSSPQSVAMGDFNADGKMDLGVTSNLYNAGFYGPGFWGYYGYYQGNWYPGYFTGAAHVLIGNGLGDFSDTSSGDLGTGYHTSAAVADFNGDGNPDFATTNLDYGTVDWLAGNGVGNLGGPAVLDAGGSAGSVAAGDVNGDGKTDLVTANQYSNAVGVLLGNGLGGFGAVHTYGTGNSPTSVTLADFNRDGNADIATADSSDNQVAVVLGRGDGSFTLPTISAAGAGSWAMAASDFNGDGWPDAVTSNTGEDNVSVLINDRSWIPVNAPIVSIDDATVTEGNTGSTSATFTLHLSAAYAQPITVHYATADGSATSGSDYVAGSGDVTFAAGQTTRTITVAVLGDRLPEETETFAVNLDSTAAFIGDGQGIGTILDDEPRISIGDVSVTEGIPGTFKATFVVTLTAPSTAAVTVQYTTANGTATAGSDYKLTSGTLTIPAGKTTGTIDVPILGDRLAETNETFFVQLSNPANAIILDGSGVGTIMDDEPRISINNVTKLEGKKGVKTLFVFEVTLSAGYDQKVTMSYRTVSGTATTGNKDFIAKSGTLSFAPGETKKTITIEVVGDNNHGSDEYFYVDLYGNSSNSLFTKSRGVGTILNDD